ncbi:hypothetical protein C7S14_6824 [Burkholderia cepacia]|nr:hypothetical protein C7S14_6824 [Burkholderia cepacia]
MAEKHLDFRQVLNAIEIEPKRPRGGSAKGRFGGNRQGQLPILNDD